MVHVPLHTLKKTHLGEKKTHTLNGTFIGLSILAPKLQFPNWRKNSKPVYNKKLVFINAVKDFSIIFKES